MKRMLSILTLALAALALAGCPQPEGPAAPTTVPVSFMVVETVNGTLVPTSSLSVYNSKDELIPGSPFAVTKGRATIALDPNATYSFLLDQTGYAQSAVQNYYVDPLGGNDITMIQQKLGMITRPAIAPIFADISISKPDDLTDLTPLEAGQQLSTAGTTYLLVTIAAPSAVEPTAWSGFGAKIDFDQVPSILNGVGGILLADPAWDADMSAWVSTFLFDLSDKDYVDGEHDLVLVAYDVANNRIEKHIPVMLSSLSGAGADISAAVFTSLTVNMHSFPVSRGWFGKEPGVSIMALNPYEGHDVSYRAHVSFKFTDGAATPANVPIRGFDLYRKASTDPEGAWTKVGGQMYGALSTGASGTHSCFDADSGLSADGVYQYKVVAYTDATNRKESAVASAKVYKPFKATLDLPAHRGEVEVDSTSEIKVGPSFQFLISDASLWSATESDYFFFNLEMHEKDGPYTYIGRFRYNFAAGKFQFRYDTATAYYWINFEDAYGQDPEDPEYDPIVFGNNNDDYITWDEGLGAINIPAFVTFLDEPNYATGSGVAYKAGVTYEWDIVGEIKGVTAASATPAWFQKAYTGGLSKSYADGYNEGSNTSNGRFEFVAVLPTP